MQITLSHTAITGKVGPTTKWSVCLVRCQGILLLCLLIQAAAIHLSVPHCSTVSGVPELCSKIRILTFSLTWRSCHCISSYDITVGMDRVKCRVPIYESSLEAKKMDGHSIWWHYCNVDGSLENLPVLPGPVAVQVLWVLEVEVTNSETMPIPPELQKVTWWVFPFPSLFLWSPNIVFHFPNFTIVDRSITPGHQLVKPKFHLHSTCETAPVEQHTKKIEKKHFITWCSRLTARC